ncbi:MAG: hypothetical protein IJU75_05135 [Clostridia bacterium]|nr:hypothetical protein [Clostridia bacterium]
MADKENERLSADELLRRLKENIGEDDTGNDTSAKKYKFTRAKKEQTDTIEQPLSDYSYESPVPKSNVEGLDVDALMRMYLSDEDYEVASGAKKQTDPLTETLDSAELEGVVAQPTDYQAPDQDTYSELNVDGKVCDVPQLGVKEQHSGDAEEKKTGTADGDETIRVEDLGKYLKSSAKGMTDAEFDDVFSEVPIVPINIPEEPGKDEKENTVQESVKDVPADLTVAYPVKSADESPAEDHVGSDYAEGADQTAESELEGVTVPVSETDTNIMLAFGLDEELDRTVGRDEADKLREANESEAERMISEKPKETSEYTSPGDTKEFAARYRKKYLKNAISIFGSIIVTIVLFFYENIMAMGGSLPTAVNPEYYPTVNTMVGLQILFFGFIFTLPYLYRGFVSLTKKQPTVESILPVIFVMNVLFALISMFFVPGTVFKIYFLPASIAILCVAVGRRFELMRETASFGIVASKKNKFVLESLDLGSAELETQAFNEYLPSSPDIFRISKASFVDGFVKRTQKYPSTKGFIDFFILGMLGAAVIGFATGLFKGGFAAGVTAGYTAFSFTLPVSLFLSFCLPSYRGEKIAVSDGSAFIGEAAVDDYTAASCISFDDREVFPPSGVKLRSIKMCRDDGRIDNVIYYTASIYSRIGGPLSDVLNVATADIGRSENTEILSVGKNGVEAIVEGKHIFLGKSDYIRSHGFQPEDPEEDDELEEQGISIMYLVLDDVVYSKIYVRYALEPEFISLVRAMYTSGICVGIKTIDPNIDDGMLGRRIQLDKYPVRVLKYSSLDDVTGTSDKIDSGIVSKRSAKALIRTFTLCDKMRHATKSGLVVSAIAMLIGLLAVIAVVIFGSVASIHSMLAALYQLIWIVPSIIITRLLIMK